MKAPKDMNLDELSILFSQLLWGGDSSLAESVFQEVLWRLHEEQAKVTWMEKENTPITGWPWDSPYQDGYDAGYSDCLQGFDGTR